MIIEVVKMAKKIKGRSFGFDPDEKATILVDGNCIGKSLDKPWQAAVEGLLKLDKAGHNIVILTDDIKKLHKFFADNYTVKIVEETREEKLVDVKETYETVVNGEVKITTRIVKQKEFPKVTKEVERLAFFPRIIELLKTNPDDDIAYIRYGNLYSLLRSVAYKVVILESDDSVIAKLKKVDAIENVVDYTIQSSNGFPGMIVPIKKATDWSNVDEVFDKLHYADGNLKAPPEAYKAAEEAAAKKATKEG